MFNFLGKLSLSAAFLLLLSPAPALAGPEAISEKRSLDAERSYFLIHEPGRRAPSGGYKLLLVLPGGDGSAAFNPFVTNIAKHCLGDDYLLAQLVSVSWREDQKVVWPTEHSKVPGMKSTTEEFIEEVTTALNKEFRVDDDHIYTLSWSSGGPAAYAASLESKSICGSLVAMFVFRTEWMGSLRGARDHRYYIYHSPEDKVCTYDHAETAVETLTDNKAKVKLEDYAGGHGWHGNPIAAIRKGIAWLEDN